jgi:hypothetical protein
MGSGGSCLRAPKDATKYTSEQLFSNSEKIALHKSMEHLLSIDKGPLRVGIIAFKGLFNDAPELFPLFHLEGEWEASHQFEHHCSIVIRTLCHFIKISDDKAKIEDIIDIMVSYDCMWQFTINTLTNTMLLIGKEACNDAVEPAEFQTAW